MSYLNALEQLRRIIAEDYRDGGLLLGHREMCKRLGVSIKTYSKAIQLLVKDGTISDTKSKVGTSVAPVYARTKKIGVVIGDGGDSPFLYGAEIFAGMLLALQQSGYSFQILQAAKIRQIQDVALQHGVQALVWLFPPESVIPVLKKVKRDQRFPLIIVNDAVDNVCQEAVEHKLNVVAPDPYHYGTVLVDYLVKHQHRQFLYVGSYDYMMNHIKEPMLQQNQLHFSSDNCIDRHQIPQQLLDKLTETEATLIVAGGGAYVYRQIVDVLKTVPRNKRPELLLDYDSNKQWQLPDVPVNISYIGADGSTIGNAVGEVLCAHLIDGSELKTNLLPCYRVFSA